MCYFDRINAFPHILVWGSSFLCLIPLPPPASARLRLRHTHRDNTDRDHTDRDTHTEITHTETTHTDKDHTHRDHTHLTWQAQHFVNLHVQNSWQAQHFVNLHAPLEAVGVALSAVVGGCRRWSPVRPSIAIRVFTCFLTCRIRGRRSTL